VRALALDSDGRSVAFTTFGSSITNQLKVLDLSNGRSRLVARAQTSHLPAFFGELAWRPSGRGVIAVTRGPSLTGAAIALIDTRTGRTHRSFDVSARLDGRVAWTMDGRGVFFSQASTLKQMPSIRLLDVGSGQTSPTGIRALDPAVSPSGILAFASADGIRTRAGGQTRHVRGTRKGDRAPAWTAGGKLILLERPIGACPRDYIGIVCSQILVTRIRGGEAKPLLGIRARAPATR
jgi:hypothetical protein